MFVLVRHAHAGNKRLWRGADTGRPLSQEGREQVVGLTPVLILLEPARLLSSPYLRCRQTLTPLAGETGIALQDSELLLPDADPAALGEFLRDPSSERAVCCTHGETLAALLRAWAHDGLLTQPRPSTTPKGGAWIVTGSGGALSLRFVSPQRRGSSPPR